jgi:hypothetical protein
MDGQNAKFEGWAMIELFGHGHEAGFVTTQYYGDKAMFQVDVPEIPARQETLTRPKWSDSALMPAGTVIEKETIPGRTRLINPGAIYSINPATEAAVREVISRSERREIKVISMPAQPERTLLPGEPEDGEPDMAGVDASDGELDGEEF